MRLEADDPMAYFMEVMDLDTHQTIQGCEWADQETGEYQVAILEDNRIRREVRKGNIVLVYKGE